MIRVKNSYKLVTKEDSTHFHKILGILCLINYGYRYYLLLSRKSMELNNNFSVMSVLIHGALSCSSMIFHIPHIRNRTAPMIYPEYRLHSILFVLRSVVCFLLTYFDFGFFYKVGVCYLTMVLADVVTIRYQSNSTTMRNMPFDSRISEKDQMEIIMMQSSQQIGATLFMFGNLDSCFSPMFAIQIAAFLMTLVRKNIIDSNMWHLIYNISLWMNIFCYYSLPIGYLIIQPNVFHIFYYWRFSFEKSKSKNQIIFGNKYIGWTLVFLVMHIYNTHFDEKITMYLLQNNYDVVIRYGMMVVYIVTQTRRARGLFIKTDT